MYTESISFKEQDEILEHQTPGMCALMVYSEMYVATQYNTIMYSYHTGRHIAKDLFTFATMNMNIIMPSLKTPGGQAELVQKFITSSYNNHRQA